MFLYMMVLQNTYPAWVFRGIVYPAQNEQEYLLELANCSDQTYKLLARQLKIYESHNKVNWRETKSSLSRDLRFKGVP